MTVLLGFESRDPRFRSDKDIVEAYDGMKETLENELKNTLPPELLNRLDDIVIFRSLTRRDAKKIVDLLLDDLNARLSEKMVKVSLDLSAKDFIVERGFSENMRTASAENHTGYVELRCVISSSVRRRVVSKKYENKVEAQKSLKSLCLKAEMY